MAEGQMINLGHMMKRWSQVIVASLRKEITQDDTKASGRLLASIRPQVKIFGNKFVMEIVMEDYWKSVDQGTKPGTKPDVNKILKWMRHKGIQPSPVTRTNSGNVISTLKASGKLKRKLSKKIFKDRRLALAERIANAIQRKGTIKRFGYKGSGFVTEYIQTLEQKMTQSIKEATGKDITIQIKQALK